MSVGLTLAESESSSPLESILPIFSKKEECPSGKNPSPQGFVPEGMVLRSADPLAGNNCESSLDPTERSAKHTETL